VFVHIPKTGGQTLFAVLARQYAFSQTVTVTDPSDPLTPFRDVARRATPTLIRGHVPFGVHEELVIDPIYITILRQPIDRVVSIYRYIERYEEHPLHAQVRADRMTLSDFVESGIDREEVENGQTRQLAGLGAARSERHMLERAKAHLRTFSAVGLTERFDESLILFRRRLDWRMPFYVSKNVAPSGTSAPSIPDDVRSALVERNADDLELYRFAAGLFEEQTTGTGLLRAEVAAFRALNRLAGIYQRLT
jgi:hypothetical protein